MDSYLKFKSAWGDYFVVSYSDEGYPKAAIENSGRVTVLDDIEVMGMSDYNTLAVLKGVNPRVLSSRFKLSRFNDKSVLLYNEGLKGGGTCLSKNKHREKPEPKTHDEIDVNAEVQTLPTHKKEQPVIQSVQVPMSKSDAQNQAFTYITQTKEAVIKGLKSDIKITELSKIHPSYLLHPEVISMELMSVLLIDPIWTHSWLIIRQRIAMLARRFIYCFMISKFNSLQIIERTKDKMMGLIVQVKDKINQNYGIVRNSGLLCEILAIDHLYMDMIYSKDWCKSALQIGDQLLTIYKKSNHSLSATDLLISYKKMRARFDRNFMTVLSFLDNIELDIHDLSEFNECLLGILKSIMDYGWKEIYPTLSLLETAILTERCTDQYLIRFLRAKFRIFYRHKNSRIREKAASILNICAKHKNEQIREIAQTIYDEIYPGEKDSAVRYVLTQPIIMYEMSISPFNNSTSQVVKICLNNLTASISSFVGRSTELLTISKEFFQNNQDRHFNAISIVGLEGVGKSTLAHQFALENVSRYDIIWWIHSDTQESFHQCLYNLAEELKLDHKNIKLVLADLKLYLSNPNVSSLLIFDNAHITEFIYDFLPTNGHFIYTARNTLNKFKQLQLNPLPTNESAEFLSYHILSLDQKDSTNILSKLLGGLPLALIQASVYINKSSTELGDFIKSLSKIKQKDHILRDIILRNIQILKNESKLILQIICLVNSKDIQYEMLFSIFKDRFPDTNTSQFNTYIQELIEFNITLYDVYKESLKLHPILHVVLSNHYRSQPDDSFISATKDYFIRVYKYDRTMNNKHRIDILKQLTPHVQQFIHHYNQVLDVCSVAILTTELAQVTNNIFIDTIHSLLYIQKARKLLNSLPPMDLCIATAFSNLGSLYKSIPDYQKAEESYKNCLDIQQRLLPPDHINIATTYNYLGLLNYSKGDNLRAEEYYIKSRDIRLKVLPPNHPALATTYNNLGVLYTFRGNYNTAEKLLFNARDIRLNALPSDDPQVATTYNNIGEFYYAKASYSQALEYFSKASDIRLKVLPTNSKHLANTFNNLGLVYYAIGDYMKAEEYHIKTKDISEKMLLIDNLDIARTYHNLGGVYQAKGEYEQALKYYEKCKDIYERLAPDTPSLATTYHNLASFYQVNNDLEQAEEYYIMSKQIREKVLPHDSLSIATTYNNLGQLYYKTGNFKEAERLYIRCRNIREKVLPVEHQSISDIYHHLGILYKTKGHYSRAEECFSKTIKQEEVYIEAD